MIMTQRFQGGHFVTRAGRPLGERGMVLGYDEWGSVLVSWQFGYMAVTPEDEAVLDPVEVLDLMVEAFDGKETKFRFGYPQEQRPPRRKVRKT